MVRMAEVGAVKDLGARLGRLQDEEDIRQVLLQYCRGLDEHDMPLFLDQFEENIRYSYDGKVWNGRASLSDVIRKNWVKMPQTQHLLGNLVISFGQDAASGAADDQADTTSDCLALAILDTGAMQLVTAAYRDRLVRRDGQWRFVERVIETGGPFSLGQKPAARAQA